jgi:hypothetical protein
MQTQKNQLQNKLALEPWERYNSTEVVIAAH